MSCDGSHGYGLDLALLRLWGRPAAESLLQLVTFKRLCTEGAAKKKKKKKKKKKSDNIVLSFQ